MSAHLMSKGRIQAVIVGADRIAANGDTANKIGTYGVSILAREHGIPFYVAAPWSTIDMRHRHTATSSPSNSATLAKSPTPTASQMTPDGVGIENPAFDVTPARYITGIITERGVLKAPPLRSPSPLPHVRAAGLRTSPPPDLRPMLTPPLSCRQHLGILRQIKMALLLGVITLHRSLTRPAAQARAPLSLS